jgi:hypothetical protein
MVPGDGHRAGDPGSPALPASGRMLNARRGAPALLAERLEDEPERARLPLGGQPPGPFGRNVPVVASYSSAVVTSALPS